MRNSWVAGTRFVQHGFHCWCCAPNESLAVIIKGYVNGPSIINLTVKQNNIKVTGRAALTE